MDNNNNMDLDLNSSSYLDDMETSNSGIENRFRILEVVNNNRRLIEPVNESVNETISGGRMRNCKRDMTHLAKALEMDIDRTNDDEKGGGNGNFYDCNICLEIAKDPVLTCCGHLFCWPCFYQVQYVDSVSKECPVCKGEVVDSSVTPIYGDGNGNGNGNGKGVKKECLEMDSKLEIPPRPRARRVESVRQQSFGRGNVRLPVADVGRGSVRLPVADVVRRISVGLDMFEERRRSILSPTSGISLNNSEAETSREGRQLSMVMSESTNSISSISSALNNAERFVVGDLETQISDAPQPVYQGRVTSVANANVDIQSDSLQNRATALLHLGNLTTGGSVEIDLTISRSDSTRRMGATRDLNVEDDSASEHRRRRLR